MRNRQKENTKMKLNTTRTTRTLNIDKKKT